MRHGRFGPDAGATIAYILARYDIGMLACADNNSVHNILLTLMNTEVVRLCHNAAIKKIPRDLIRMLPAMLWRTSFRSIIVEPEILDANNNRVGLRHRG